VCSSDLETVAQAALGVSKIKYNGTFMDLYTGDFETYVYYNAVDTFLVYLIDKKLKTLQTFLMLGNVTKVEALKAFSPIWMTEVLVAREFYTRKRVVAEMKKATKTSSFEGAYVKQPKPGLHEWIATFDFASLYPSTMRQWNISPETFKGKNLEHLEENWLKTASGGVFDNTEDSVLRTILTLYFNQRKEAKNKSFVLEMEIDYLKKVLVSK
jgi:DNA polymerase elongation subunit (family B)